MRGREKGEGDRGKEVMGKRKGKMGEERGEQNRYSHAPAMAQAIKVSPRPSKKEIGVMGKSGYILSYIDSCALISASVALGWNLLAR